MKYLSITKLILGIFSITIACIFVFYQISLGNPLFDFMKHSGGTTPLLISGCFLLAGILSILTRKEDRLESSNLIYAGSFTCSMFYFTAAILGYKYTGNYHSFNFFTVLSLLLGMIHIYIMKYERNKENIR